MSNDLYIDRLLERMNNCELTLMECVADLRTLLYKEEYMLCDWHGTM